MQTNPQISRFHSCFKIKLASQRLYPCLIRRRLRWDCGRKCGKESRFGPAGVNEGEREEMNACKPSNRPEAERDRAKTQFILFKTTNMDRDNISQFLSLMTILVG